MTVHLSYRLHCVCYNECYSLLAGCSFRIMSESYNFGPFPKNVDSTSNGNFRYGHWWESLCTGNDEHTVFKRTVSNCSIQKKLNSPMLAESMVERFLLTI